MGSDRKPGGPPGSGPGPKQVRWGIVGAHDRRTGGGGGRARSHRQGSLRAFRVDPARSRKGDPTVGLLDCAGDPLREETRQNRDCEMARLAGAGTHPIGRRRAGRVRGPGSPPGAGSEGFCTSWGPWRPAVQSAGRAAGGNVAVDAGWREPIDSLKPGHRWQLPGRCPVREWWGQGSADLRTGVKRAGRPPAMASQARLPAGPNRSPAGCPGGERRH
jgi:hypothetical protein